MIKLPAGLTALIFCIFSILSFHSTSYSITLSEIRARGELRHLGVPYARFADTNADGLDCALMRRFSEYIGVTYKFIPTTWTNAIPDLTGFDVHSNTTTSVKGDVLASGLTILKNRKQHVLFSLPTFTAQVWLLAKPKADIQPISPTGNLSKDIIKTIAKTSKKTVYGIENICIDVRLFPHLQNIAGAVKNVALQSMKQPISFITSKYNIFLMESPSALMALETWPYSFKIIGPIARQQNMGVAFALDSPELKEKFNVFFTKLWESGEYRKLVNCYYPNSYIYFNKFFMKSSP
ncbi:transporter substrate-binding domain-containing protein [Halodesulfovibrio spirochaetisodalis]|uniref:transporter substrate-binding domain-containing protein n=1 Tax=Halodesulfovibrio spirochaetisodalis TaxID=1560234 RepID=UPI0008364C4B|nr:transporter substrate-binding domain-containing protein [Halodesulfovibrio spirochaetisodalis]